MENSLYIGLSGQIALQENMNIIANNVANMSTPGFRGQNMIFEEFIEKPRGMEEDMTLVLDYGQYQTTDPGPIKQTGSPLDVALIGPGFLGVQTAEGVQYTRAGNMSINPEGVLTNARGQPMANIGGGEIIIPQDAREVRIDDNGVISTDQGEISQLMIMEFDNQQILDPAGNGLYRTEDPGVQATRTVVKQGSLEGSNVQPIVEMTRMIEVLREYQATQRMMQTEHERQRTAIQRMSRAGS